MNPRLLAAVAAALLVAALPPSAHAAKRKRPVPPVCNLVRDDLDDTTLRPTVTSDSLDIVGADIASNAKKVTGVIRLKAWPETEPNAPTGRTYQIQFRGKDAETYAFLSFVTTPLGNGFGYGFGNTATRADEGRGAATGRLDPARKEIHITAAIEDLANNQRGNSTGSFRPGVAITDIEVVTGRWLGAWSNPDLYVGKTERADHAAGDRDYRAGAKSCVRVG